MRACVIARALGVVSPPGVARRRPECWTSELTTQSARRRLAKSRACVRYQTVLDHVAISSRRPFFAAPLAANHFFFALKFCCDFFPVVLVSCYRVGIVILIALVVVVSFIFMSFDETCGQKTGRSVRVTKLESKRDKVRQLICAYTEKEAWRVEVLTSRNVLWCKSSFTAGIEERASVKYHLMTPRPPHDRQNRRRPARSSSEIISLGYVY